MTTQADDIMARNMRETGWYIHRQHDTTPAQFQVLGERACGTNVVRKLIEKAWRIERTEGLGWKHAFPTMVAIPKRLVVICVQREPVAWAKSLYKRPWHAHPDLQELSFSQFIRTEWRAIVDRTADFEMVHPEIDADGQPLQFDRHPITGAAFETIFALRCAKAQALLGMRNRGCDVVYVQLEAIQRDAEAFVDAFGAAFDLTPTERGFRPVTRRMGNRFRPSVAERMPAPDVLEQADAAFIAKSLDPKVETAWGYAVTDEEIG